MKSTVKMIYRSVLHAAGIVSLSILASFALDAPGLHYPAAIWIASVILIFNLAFVFDHIFKD